jgi:hypothetical protein
MGSRTHSKLALDCGKRTDNDLVAAGEVEGEDQLVGFAQVSGERPPFTGRLLPDTCRRTVAPVAWPKLVEVP